MGIREDDYAKARVHCQALGLHPIIDPGGEEHHTDAPMTAEDLAIGGALAFFLGTLFADVNGKDSRYSYEQMTSIDEWSRVARALRIHGLAIGNDTTPRLPNPKERANLNESEG